MPVPTTQELFDLFNTWLKETYGEVTAYNISSNQTRLNTEWNNWFTNIYSKTTTTTKPTVDRTIDIKNMYYITSVTDPYGADGKVIPYGYETRIANYITQLQYAGALTQEEAAKAAQDAKSWVESYNRGEISFEELPYVNELSKSDYPDWFKWNTKNRLNELSSYNKQQQDISDINAYNQSVIKASDERAFLENAKVKGEWAANAGMEQKMPVTYTATSLGDLDKFLATHTQNKNDANYKATTKTVYDPNQNFALDTSQLANALEYQQQQAATELAKKNTVDYNGMPSTDPTVEEYATKMGLSPAQKSYLYSSGIYNKFTEDNPGSQGLSARELWWKTIKDSENAAKNFQPANTALVDYGANSSIIKNLMNSLDASQGGNPFTTPSELAQGAGWYANNPNDPTNSWIWSGMTADQKKSLDYLGQTGLAQTNAYNKKGTSISKAVDPYKTYLSSYPFLQEWFSLSPSQRGTTLPTISSRWQM
jgi:hypothetical protein